MTPEERKARAVRVSMMLENGELDAAFRDVKADLHAEWERCFDSQERDNLWRSLHILNLVREKLTSLAGAANDGSLSAIRRVK